MYEMKNVSIDYTVYSFMYTLDFERGGIRIEKGAGILTVPWKNIKRIDIIFSPRHHNTKLIMTSGKEEEVKLVRDSKGRS